jgi:protein-S-isoprenylcysteine O-methyltransferase Ste14
MILPLPFVWPYALAFWGVFFWAFTPEFTVIRKAQKSEAARSAADAGSMRAIVIGNQFASLLGLAAPFIFPGASIPTHRLTIFWIGTAVLISGSLLRRHCFRVLGKFFTGAVTVQSDHVVIDHGAYRWVRHPSYTAGIGMFGGIGLAMGNWVSIAVMTLEPIVVYAYRVKVEERALVESLGEPYRAYMRTHKRFIPFVV